MEAVRGQKHPSDAKNDMKELIYWKKYLIKVSQQPQKPSSESNQIWATTSDKKDTATDLRGVYENTVVDENSVVDQFSGVGYCTWSRIHPKCPQKFAFFVH